MAHHPSRLKIKIVLWNAYKLYMIIYIYIYIIYSIEYHPLTLSIRWKKIILLIRILRSDAIFLILSHSNHISPSLSFSFILSFSLSLSSFALNSLPFSLSLSLTLSLALATLLKCELIVDTMLQNNCVLFRKNWENVPCFVWYTLMT